MSFARALKWSFLSELSSKLLQPIVFVVLARLLTPEDFGVMSAALMVVAFSQIFWEAGMGKALIQRQTDIRDAANVAFWVNLALAVIIIGLLYIAASPIALTFFQDERVTTVIQVMTLQVFLGALGSVQTALLQKELSFRKLFWARFAAVGLPGLASIPLAWQGMGYWALVAGTLAGQTAQVIVLWRMSAWRPSWSFPVPIAREMGRFGAWVGLSGLLAWFYLWMDSLVVGMYLGSHDLGLYRTGNQFSAMVFALLFVPITPVLYSHLARMNGDRERIKMAAEKVIQVLILIAVPVAAVIFSLSDSIATALFGEKWEGIGLVIGAMGLVHGFSWIVSMNGEFYCAMGKPAYETIIGGVTLLVYLCGYLYSIGFGFEPFLWARFALALLSLMLHLFIFSSIASLSISKIVKYIILISLISFFSVFIVSHFLSDYELNTWVSLLLNGLISALIIGGIFYYMEKEKMIRHFISILNP